MVFSCILNRKAEKHTAKAPAVLGKYFQEIASIFLCFFFWVLGFYVAVLG